MEECFGVFKLTRFRSWIIVTLLAAFSAVAALACGQAEEPTATPRPTTPPATQPTATAAPSQTQPPAPTATPVPAAGQVPSPKGAAGTITVAVIDVPPGVGLGRAQAPVEDMNYIGVGEAPFTATKTNPVEPMLATGFELEPDLSGGRLTVRQGVQFHQGFGEMTAQDFVWSMNDANAALTPESIHGQAGDFAALFGANPWTAVDNYTVAFKFQSFDPRWNSNFLNEAAQALSILSKRAYDERGEDWVREHIIATGPFQVVEWVQDNRVIVEKVPYNHWRGNAKIDKLVRLEVVEEATRISMLQTGEVDAADISLKSSPSLLQAGFKTASTGLGFQMGVFFSGNMWEEKHAITGEKLNLTGHYVHDLPWIGNPFNPNDANNPQGIDDMEQARLVRQALARSIDRELINETLLSGQGWPVYVEYFDINNPRWQKKWEYPYDPAEAERLLDQAGYKRGANGKRFEMSLYIGPELGGGQGISGEIGDAIAGFWQEVGLDVPVLKYAYASFRPTVVARSNAIPWLTSCDEGKSTWPWDWPKGLVMTSMTRGGFGCGFEDPFIAKKWLEVAKVADPNKRAEMNDEVVQHLFDQALGVGVVTVPQFIIYNPRSIASWEMSPALFVGVNDYENIVPAAR